jgi:hypothetical protein
MTPLPSVPATQFTAIGAKYYQTPQSDTINHGQLVVTHLRGLRLGFSQCKLEEPEAKLDIAGGVQAIDLAKLLDVRQGQSLLGLETLNKDDCPQQVSALYVETSYDALFWFELNLATSLGEKESLSTGVSRADSQRSASS